MRLDGHDVAAIALAAQRLAEGGLVAFATETVYGLGARADDDTAVAAIYAAKGRPSDHPLIVHVVDAAAASFFATTLPSAAQRLTHAFWPGPLTVIVPRAEGRAAGAAAQQATVGLRCPAHPVAQSLLQAAQRLGVPGVAAPSANRFGRISPTTAEHVEAEFGAGLWVLDGGACDVGIESTIVDCSRAHPVLLRPGVLTRERIEAVLGTALFDADAQAPRAPGTLESHYAPRATLRLMERPMLEQALSLLGPVPAGLAVYSRGPAPRFGARFMHRRMPDSPEAAAHELFAVLRELDTPSVDLIWVEAPPAGSAWDGVRDRLRRAAAA